MGRNLAEAQGFLREVLSWLDETPAPFSSLAPWWTHASAVWETLQKYGPKLLHYGTIADVEAKKALAALAKRSVREVPFLPFL